MFSFQSMLFSVAAVIFSLVLIYLIISLFEYLIHKHIMHRKQFPKGVYGFLPYLLDAFEAHAVRHHRQWYHKFDYEPDPVGREENLAIIYVDIFALLVFTFPVWATLMWFNFWYGAIFISIFFVHRLLWNTLHRQMHIPNDVFFRQWMAFRFLARHHFLHHQNTGKNFNVVFPGADFLLGSVGAPQFGDVRELLRLGHIVPRSTSAKKNLQRQGYPLLGANQ